MSNSFQIIQYAVISFVVIAVIHYLISHLMDNLTTPQVRDLVSSTNDQYETIIKKLEGQISKSKQKRLSENKRANDEMKESLKSYLKDLNNTQTNTSNPTLPTDEQTLHMNTMFNSSHINSNPLSNDELAYADY